MGVSLMVLQISINNHIHTIKDFQGLHQGDPTSPLNQVGPLSPLHSTLSNTPML